MNYSEAIMDCLKRKVPYSTITDVRKDIDNIEKLYSDELISRFESDNTINVLFKKKIRPLLSCIKPQIEWDVTPVFPHNVIEENGKFNLEIKVGYELQILSQLNELEIYINKLLELLKSLQRPYLKYSDDNLLYGIQQLLELSKGPQKDRLEEFVEGYFEVKLVSYEGEFASEDYFRLSTANVETPLTTVKAIVSKTDGICIEKGIYVEPLNSNQNE